MYNLNLTSNQAFWTQVLVWKDYGGIKKKSDCLVQTMLQKTHIQHMMDHLRNHEIKAFLKG